ncbi:MAG: amino acid adenylation domain-containing protein, partial [Planctomycetales bacterium]|nr:amino acid adenylation domain-containing protein [Planctomycetales bacterium]
DQTRYLADTLNRFFEENLFPIRVAQFTSLFRFMFPPDLEYADLLYFHLLDRGIFTRGWADNCFLSTEHSAEDVEKIIAAVKDSCLEIRQGGFMPKPVASATCDVAGTASKEVVEQSGNGDEVGTRFPLTQTQQEILLTSKHSPEAAYANNEPFTLRLTGTLNVPQLQSAVDTVLSRHPILHVRIDEAGEYQELRPPQRFEMVHRDLRQLPADARAAEITATTIRFASTVFDVYHDPLVRIELLRLTDNDHLLIIDGHHIVTDGWSWNVMLKEMGQVYSALQAGTEIHLPQPGSFREYVLSTPQRDEDAEVALRYWLDKYSTIPAPLDLPLDNPRPPRQTYAANSVIHDFSESTYRALKQIAANNNVSLFTAGLAAYQLLVSRLSGQPDVVIGMRTAGQSILDNQDLVGLCMNVLPIRVQLSPESTFRELLRSVHHEVLEAFEHQDCTLGKIVRNLKVPRQSNRMPLTDLHFNLDKDSTDIRFSGLKAEVGMTVKRAINHDLFFNLNETPTGLKLYWDYNRDLFDESTVMRWIEHYETILESLASDANQKLSDVSILSERQLKTTAITWNATEREYPRDKSVIDLFEEQAERTPQARAVTFGASSLDYTTLNTKANQLARQLQSQGVTNGTFVGILLERSEQMVIATLAALKAGATYVPMDPEFPTDRLKLMVQDSGLDCLLTQSSLTSRDIAPHATQILVDGHATNIASQSGNNLRLPIANEQAAYVIYTSGSTGVPKGVQIPHRALTNFLCSMLHEPGLNSSDTLAGVTTLSFDIAALELYLPLICGAHLLVVTQSDSTDGKRLADLLSTHHVTVLQATPATWRLMIESGWQGKPDLKILCGGEAMPSSLANQLVHSGSEVWNMYGPTETTVWSTVKRIADPGQRVTIGRPIANTQVYILDSSHRSVPVGVLGDLYIGGDGLATGYLNRQELTAERFANISVNGLSPVRLYNTGDQARFLPDGEIEFVGRSDFQVKISGYRIELGEIESVLNRHPNIRQSVATVFEDASGHKRLVGYVRTNEGEKPYAVIRDYLKENLPNYMVPTTLEFLDEFPLTPNGKVDRKLLPAPSSDRPELAVGYVAERTPVEEQIAAIFREVVNIDRVGVHDNFFELGGHSLSATKVVARLGQLFSVPLTIADVFESPTVAELATQIGQSQQSLSQNSLSDMPISRARRETRQVLR